MALQCPMPAWLLPVLLLLAASALTSAQDRKTQFSDQDKKELVVTHNRLRQAVSPPAAAMNFVVWSDKIEENMKKAAATCKDDHTKDQVGENVYAGFRSGATEITLLWYSERKFISNYYTAACENGKVCGHYTQLMTDAVTEIGCGMQWCPARNDYVVFCGYNVGNGYYKSGAHCSNCSTDMPFCLNGLCVSKDIKAGALIKDVDTTATATSAECKLICTNCGTRVINSGECKCSCKTGTSGALCEIGTTTETCSLCQETPPCENGGVADASDKTKCKCTCINGFVGDRCEIPKDVFDNSVKLVLAAKNKIVKDTVPMPISRALFNSKIWTTLQTELANAVNVFCRVDATNFAKCCPAGKTFPGADKVASAAHISAKDVEFTESSVKNSEDGSLHLFVHAKVSSSALCATVTRKKRSAAKPEYVKQSDLLSAITLANATAISARLQACCEDVVLKVEVDRAPAKAGHCPTSTLLPWPLSLLLLLVLSIRA